ncbi:carboxymuconolactone decarboxylase family protein [Haliea sp. E17]|uniref:carboxymuconolactone decarboxylase family protein n=1 Tax=Haliea sp. E17 TaxID=3401576 RepID=UPI003AAD34F9
MRVDLPEEYRENPTANLGRRYPSEILAAAQNYGAQPYQHSTLSLRELEGARYRTALINGCNVCKNFRGARDFPGLFEVFDGDLENSVYTHGPAPDEAYYQNVLNWRDYPGYSTRERVAIAYAEGMGEAPQAISADEEFWALAKSVFSDEEIVEMTYSIAAWMGLGRAMHVLGMDTVCSFAPLEAEV